MKKLLVLFLFGMILLPSVSLFSGDSLSYSLQIRTRSEANGKDFNSDSDMSSYTFLRTRLSLSFKPTKGVSAFFQLQDSRLFGSETSTLADGSADALDLHQAYFKVNDLFGLPLTLKLGRMEAVYGPQRLIGSVGWHNIGRSFDGVVFTYNFSKVSLDLFKFKEVENMAAGDLGDKSFCGVYGDFKLSKKMKTQAFLVRQKMIPTDDLSRFTAGVYLKGKSGKLSHELEFAYQFGNIGDLDISAYLVAANVGFGLSKGANISLGVDYLSGDDNKNDSDYKVFDTLYATNHKYYGFMDYFLNIPVHTFGLGIMDIHAKVTIKPLAKTVASLKFHKFSANADYALLAGGTSKDFGNEIDLTVKYKYQKNLTFVLGASVFMPGDVFKEVKGPDAAPWFYLMTIFNIK